METVYAEEYAWPLGAAVLLLIADALIGEAPRRRRKGRRGLGLARVTVLTSLILPFVVSCAWDPSRPFDRDAPAVKQAVSALDSGKPGAAVTVLEDYLSTGACKDGNIGTPDALKVRPDGTFDLGLSLFAIGEHFGRRFPGKKRSTRASPRTRVRSDTPRSSARVVWCRPPRTARKRRASSGHARTTSTGTCRFSTVRTRTPSAPTTRRSRSRRARSRQSESRVGRDATAYNRAIALQRIEDRKDAGAPDASRDASEDAPHDAAPPPHDGGDGPRDSGGGGNDASSGAQDAGTPPPPARTPGAEPPEGGAQPPPSSDEDQRMLDQLENAPTLQQEEAKRFGRRRVRGMADK